MKTKEQYKMDSIQWADGVEVQAYIFSFHSTSLNFIVFFLFLDFKYLIKF